MDDDDDRHILDEAGLGLGDVDELVSFDATALGLNLEDDFSTDFLGNSLLNGSVDGLLGNDSLGFNLEEALKLVGLDEVQPEVS